MARLAVHPSYRRKKVANRLVAVAEAGLRKLGAQQVGALVVTGNGPAERFWKTAGYHREAAITRFVKDL
jgi:predicted N-acetyltransferase YhbS